jgi:hypothetical protein
MISEPDHIEDILHRSGYGGMPFVSPIPRYVLRDVTG